MDAVLEFLRDHRQEMVEDLGRFVEHETPSTDKARLDDFAGLLADYASATGGEPETVPMREAGDHLRVTWGDPQAEPPVLLIGHFDTVWPVGSLERMPFRVEDGVGRGPGIFDMKGGLVQGFWALRALRETGRLRRPVVFFCNSDEEVHSESSRGMIEAEASRAAAALVLESSDGGLITTERKGVGSFRLRVTGRETHAGVDPFGGVSAVEELARLTLWLHSHSDPETGTTVNVGTVRGGTRPNVVAGEAAAEVNLRAVTGEEAERMTDLLLNLKPYHKEARVEVSGGLKRPPMRRTESTARLFGLAGELSSGLGFELSEAASGGGSDGNFCAARGVPVLDSLGAVGGGAHATSEHVRVETMPERAALVARLVEEV